MAAHHTATADLRIPHGTTAIGRRVDGVVVTLIIVALFAALAAAYFGVNAGTDLPEPWAQMSD